MRKSVHFGTEIKRQIIASTKSRSFKILKIYMLPNKPLTVSIICPPNQICLVHVFKGGNGDSP